MMAETFDGKAFAKALSTRPGVYRMLDAKGKVLYVGKARNLRRRVGSYFSRREMSPKLVSLIGKITAIETTVTNTEGEALLLENQLIKSHKPRYNVTYRDDKSYPFIYLASEDRFPRLAFHRGPKKLPGRYFGPYPSAGAVRESLNLIQKLFRVRQCEDTFFRNRTRPCLQYQIERCTGPCVDLVDENTYAEDVEHAVMFLEGRSSELAEALAERMETAAEAQDYELAGRYRDQIVSLQRVQQRQYVAGEHGDIDVVAASCRAGVACAQVFFIRDGRNLGNKTFFPRVHEGDSAAEVLSAFVPQYYMGKEVPPEIFVSDRVADRALLETVFREQAGRKVKIVSAPRGERARWLDLARENAEQALAERLASRRGMRRRLEALQAILGLDAPPGRIEGFDISHSMGEATVAACVVFDAEGPVKSDYRRFNITGVQPGDDYAALRQAVERRYRRLKTGEGKLPDLLLLDGGKGQLAQAVGALTELQVDGVCVAAVSKGPGRRAGDELLHVAGRSSPMRLAPDAPALHLIQAVRDEAHRFAITGHRQGRARKRQHSVLEGVPGIGPKRRRELLRRFGGLQGLVRASAEDLTAVPGISRQLAERVVDALREEKTG
jgi:excinuclease ABC subunit C